MTKIDMAALETVTGGTPQQVQKASHYITSAASGLVENPAVKAYFNRLKNGVGQLTAVTDINMKAGQTLRFGTARPGTPAH